MHRHDDRALWLARHVLPHEPALRAWLSRRAVPGLDADDIVQETYARLARGDLAEEIADPRNYLFRAAHSVIASHVRRSRVVSIHSFAQFDTDMFVDDSPDPETVAIDRDELSRLARAISDLPPRIRQVFILRRVERLRQREVAERLGVSESTVEKQMTAALRKLGEMFAGGGNRFADASRHGTKGKSRPNAAGDKPGD